MNILIEAQCSDRLDLFVPYYTVQYFPNCDPQGPWASCKVSRDLLDIFPGYKLNCHGITSGIRLHLFEKLDIAIWFIEFMIQVVILTILRIIGSKKTERNNKITGQRANTLQWTSKSFNVPKGGHNCAMAEAWISKFCAFN